VALPRTASLDEPGGSQMPVTYYVALPFIRTDGIATGQGQVGHP
jgi:hypothetical protein